MYISKHAYFITLQNKMHAKRIISLHILQYSWIWVWRGGALMGRLGVVGGAGGTPGGCWGGGGYNFFALTDLNMC